ncbi:RDD domain-containing protein [Frankia sp. R43]|uniref:RDD family protein n=1 Tax=Frankia sp. R43 TaxID=269536 RepID=UPI0006CA03E9|nr:RDD family protein [Frankia sp. R43]KPM51439.1 RDD domain-containing protein [Frankia sp. R43]
MSGFGLETNQLVTGEAVPIDLRVARLGSRMIAGIIDLVIQTVAQIAIVIATLEIVGPDDEAMLTALVLAVYVVTMLGYPVACETLLRGRTFGKMALGLRVVRDDGGPIRFRHALVRGLVGVVAERPGVLAAVPAIISMTVSRRSKRLGDLVAGTIVLQMRVPRTVGVAPVVPPQLAGWAALLDLTGVNDHLATRTRRFLDRANQLSDDARTRMGGDLLTEVLAAVTPPPPPGTPEWAVLSTVLAERTRRAYQRMITTTATRPPRYPG